jgi:hypothetical protein
MRLMRSGLGSGSALRVCGALGAAVILIACQSGCHSIGPSTVPRDRSDYASAISDSWKRQALLNIVRLRYLDPPIFVDVGQIVAGYTLETTLTGSASFPQTTNFGGNTAAVAGAGRFTDRPTITYTPLTGNRFVKGLMTPLPPESVFFTIESGWPADGVLFATVASFNGLKNQETSLGRISPPDPKFMRAIALMRKLQLSNSVGMRIQTDANKQQSTLLTFRTQDISPETIDDSRELRSLLRLDPDATSFKLVFGATSSSDKEVAVQTRSILHLMQTMASQVQVPPEHLSQGRVTPGWESVPDAAEAQRFIRIESSTRKPSDAFVTVNYRGHWFWIDDSDLRTKRAFAFMMLLFTLADTGEKENLPLVTIPAQ